jgi:hypothetical protein
MTTQQSAVAYYASLKDLCDDFATRYLTNVAGIPTGAGIMRRTRSIDLLADPLQWMKAYNNLPLPTPANNLHPLSRLVLYEITIAAVSCWHALERGRYGWTDGPPMNLFKYAHNAQHGPWWFTIGFVKLAYTLYGEVGITRVGHEPYNPMASLAAAQHKE